MEFISWRTTWQLLASRRKIEHKELLSGPGGEGAISLWTKLHSRHCQYWVITGIRLVTWGKRVGQKCRQSLSSRTYGRVGEAGCWWILLDFAACWNWSRVVVMVDECWWEHLGQLLVRWRRGSGLLINIGDSELKWSSAMALDILGALLGVLSLWSVYALIFVVIFNQINTSPLLLQRTLVLKPLLSGQGCCPRQGHNCQGTTWISLGRILVNQNLSNIKDWVNCVNQINELGRLRLDAQCPSFSRQDGKRQSMALPGLFPPFWICLNHAEQGFRLIQCCKLSWIKEVVVVPEHNRSGALQNLGCKGADLCRGNDGIFDRVCMWWIKWCNMTWPASSAFGMS